MTRFVLFLSLLLSLSFLSNAQTPRDTGITIIHAGRFFDSEQGVMLTNRDIVVYNRTIEAVGEHLPVPSNARVIDLSKFTVLPGLIDAHTHLLYLEKPAGDPTSENIKAVAAEGTPLRALHGAARARTFLHAGITTVRDLGNAGSFGDFALKTAIADGSVNGPRMRVAGPGLSPEAGQFPGLQQRYKVIAEEEYRVVHNADDAAAAVTENVTYGADVIKVYSNNTPNRGALSIAEMRAIVERAELLGVRVAAHATNNAAVWRATMAGVHSIEHAYSVDDTTLQLMHHRGIAMVPTDLDSVLLVRYGKLRSGDPTTISQQATSYHTHMRDRLTRAIKAGVTIVAGSDNYIDLQMPQGEAAKHVLFAYAEEGMKPVDVLRSATINAARLLGSENRLGVLKAGAFADIIAIEGNPDTDIKALEQIRFVMKDGTIYKQP